MNVPMWSQILAGLAGVGAVALALYIPKRWKKSAHPTPLLVPDESAAQPPQDADNGPTL